MNSQPIIQLLDIEPPIVAIGKVFYGDYANTIRYVQAVQSILDKHGIPWQRNKVMGVFYDDPMRKNIDELKSFHGVFVEEDFLLPESEITMLELKGQHLYVKVEGGIDKIHEGYHAIFSFCNKNGYMLKSTTGYQVSTFKDGMMTTDIYMELA